MGRAAGEPLRVGVLASGVGTNLQALLDTVHGHEALVVAVAADQPTAGALARARAAGVQTAVFARGDYPDPGAPATPRSPTGCIATTCSSSCWPATWRC
jgi:CTP:molybdopterin cytidylyltransferase MocA